MATPGLGPKSFAVVLAPPGPGPIKNPWPWSRIGRPRAPVDAAKNTILHQNEDFTNRKIVTRYTFIFVTRT